MLQFSASVPLPFLWKSMTDKGFDGHFRRIMHYAYAVTEKGLTRWTGEDMAAQETFRVPSCKFGGDSSARLHPSMTRLVSTLRRLGAKPRYIQDDDGPAFSFLFDISADNRAVYEFSTTNHGQEIVIFVYCESLSDEIMRNVQFIDHALYTIIEECKVPVLR